MITILIKYKNIEMWGLLFLTLRRASSYENFLRVMVIMVIMMVNDGDDGGQ